MGMEESRTGPRVASQQIDKESTEVDQLSGVEGRLVVFGRSAQLWSGVHLG
jgi:hypothetical protein